MHFINKTKNFFCRWQTVSDLNTVTEGTQLNAIKYLWHVIEFR